MSHDFEPDPDVPSDYLGRAYCRCGLPDRAAHATPTEEHSTEEGPDEADR